MEGNPFRDQVDSYPLLGYVEGLLGFARIAHGKLVRSFNKSSACDGLVIAVIAP